MRHEDGEEETDDDSQGGADQRRDDALVPDHSPRLSPRHADRTEHPQLARPLEDGQHERVHDPEQADDHRQREQHVEQADDVVERLLEVRLELRMRLDLCVCEP